MNKEDYRYVEHVLKSYKAMISRRYNLNRHLTHLCKQKNNAIEGQFLQSNYIKDTPGVPHEGYKNNKLLLINNEEYDRLCDEESFVKSELEDLTIIIDSINEAFNSLTNRESDILRFFYVEKFGWQKICTIVNYSDRQCLRVKDKAMEYIYPTLEPIKNVVNMSFFSMKKAI